MIRREENGKLYLIAQDDHAALSGELARHLGNGPFESLTTTNSGLAETVITAIARHDCGWPLHDVAPTLNNRMLPRDVFESKHDVAMKMWTASADRTQDIHPYAGLLVSLHGLALSSIAMADVMTHVGRKGVAYTRERFDLNRFQHNEIDRQQGLRQIIGLRNDLPLYHGLAGLGLDPGEDLLIHHFRILQAMDRLSLALCCTKSPFDQIDLGQRPGEHLARVRVKRVGSRGMVVDPWVFDEPRITFTTPAHILPMKQYVGEAAFQAEFAEAPIESIEFMLEAGTV